MNDNTIKKASNAAFAKTRDYFLGESLKPSENIPDLLAENRKIAVSLAENVMSLLEVIANHFGIPTMELTMEALPEVSLQLGTDGVREQAAARTYPAPTLHCVAQEILRRERFVKYSPHDPLLKRIFGGSDESGDNSDDIQEDESDGEGVGEPCGCDAPEDGSPQSNPSGA